MITLRSIGKNSGQHTVLDALDLTVRRGEVFALLGPNGSGKTTTINVLTTLIRPDRGEATIAGYDVVAEPDEIKRRISLTGQAAAVDEALSATENLVMFGRLAGLGRRGAASRATELLARFDLTEAAGRRVRTFSGGMRRRLDLALSFVLVPEVLFLDEPTTGLDTRSRRGLWEVIRTLVEAGTTVFLTTQYLEEADQLADRIAVLHQGRIVGLGTADELKAQVGGDSVRLHDADGTLLREVPTDGTISDLRAALDQLDESGAAGTVSLHQPTLDDVFLALTQTTGPDLQEQR
ncbi:ABC transporter ATP-binding protein [Aeromicrobium sp. PE09-221]|nr:ABC transporter ATP-binding protein [Aeromicrobium sp. PE09-221]